MICLSMNFIIFSTHVMVIACKMTVTYDSVVSSVYESVVKVFQYPPNQKCISFALLSKSFFSFIIFVVMFFS